MRKNFTDAERAVLNSIHYLSGNAETIAALPGVSARVPFDEMVLNFMNDVSRTLLADREAKGYPDVITFAFWIRKAAVLKLKEQFFRIDGNIRLGRGTAFHIAPSNVPVNYAYSLAAGLLTGNANIVRIPSRDFTQAAIINSAINRVLEEYPEIRPYICLVRYGHRKEVNDLLSQLADTRIVWGGDAAIAEIRKSPLAPRAGEITFSNRFSLAVIDSGSYLRWEDKQRVAADFYNDTYLTDQNACTSPRLIAWMGEEKEEAKAVFWGNLHQIVQKRYVFQPIQGVNKLTSGYLLAAAAPGVKIVKSTDNLIVRVQVPEIMDGLMEFQDNSGYFLEYDCGDILELRPVCDDKRCQTVAYIGNKDMLTPLLRLGVKGIDRIVSVGRTMDFDLIWDGYNLYDRLIRVIKV